MAGGGADGGPRWWWQVTAIVAVGVLIRLAFVWFVARGDGPLGDQLYYSAQAIHNAGGGWFEQPFAPGEPAADHPPLTALVLTPVSWLFASTGAVIMAQRIFVVLMGSASVVLMALLGRRVGGQRVGVLAAGATAVYANVWVNDGLLMAETLTFGLVVVSTMLVLQQLQTPTRWRAATIGFLVGLLTLTRPEFALVGALVALLLLVRHRTRFPARQRTTDVALMAGVAMMTLVPWVAWNQLRFDAPVLVSTNDGLTIAGGNCETTYYDDVGGWDIWCAYETDIPEGYDTSQASVLMRRDGLAYWRDNLDRYPVVAAARLARVTSVGFLGANAEAATNEGRPTWVSHLGTIQYWLLIPLAVVGFRRRADLDQRFVFLGTIPVIIAVALIANAYVRFRMPAEVGLVMLAALGVDALVSTRGREEESFALRQSIVNIDSRHQTVP